MHICRNDLLQDWCQIDCDVVQEGSRELWQLCNWSAHQRWCFGCVHSFTSDVHQFC